MFWPAESHWAAWGQAAWACTAERLSCKVSLHVCSKNSISVWRTSCYNLLAGNINSYWKNFTSVNNQSIVNKGLILCIWALWRWACERCRMWRSHEASSKAHFATKESHARLEFANGPDTIISCDQAMLCGPIWVHAKTHLGEQSRFQACSKTLVYAEWLTLFGEDAEVQEKA